MKILWVALLLWAQGAWAGEMEVLCYRVGEDDLRRAFERSLKFGDGDPFEAVEEGRGALVAEAGFESRFLEGVRTLRDCSKWVGSVVGGGFSGAAVYDLEEGCLVVRAGLGAHGNLALRLRKELVFNCRTTVRFLKEEVFFEFSMLSQGGGSYAAIEGKARFLGEVSEGDGSVKVEVTHERVLMDGTLFDDWILVEESGKRPGWGMRSVAELEEDFLKVKEDGGVRRVMEVPSQFWTIFRPVTQEERDDPFSTVEFDEWRGPPAYGGDDLGLGALRKRGLIDFKGILKRQGVAFREGDFAVMLEEPPLLFFRGLEVNAELIEGIVLSTMYDPPYVAFAEVSLLEADERITEELIEKKGYRVVKKAGVVTGGEGRFSIGEEFRGKVKVSTMGGAGTDFEVQVEMDSMDDEKVKIEARVGRGKWVILTQSEESGKWRALVVLAWDWWLDAELHGRVKLK